MKPRKHNKLITAREVAALTGLSLKTVLGGKCGTGDLTVVRAGRKKLYSLVEVEEWIQRKYRKAKETPKEPPKQQASSKVIQFPGMSREEVKRIITDRTNEIENSAPAELVAVPPPQASGDDAEPGEEHRRHAGK